MTLSLGVKHSLHKASELELEPLVGVMRNPKDKRGEGQVLVNYDRVYVAVKAAIDKYSLPKPALFQSDGIDRRSSVYFSTNQEVSKNNCSNLNH